jgi:hypothetical protein
VIGPARATPDGRRAVWLVACAAAVVVAACGPAQIPPIRLWTQDLAVRVSSDPVPPHAREPVVFRIEVRDKTSSQPIEGGEGRIYATSADGANPWDGLTRGPQAGTYYGKLSFITSGPWAIGLQFRRDSTQPLETMDWRQEVLGARGEAP